MSPEEYMYSLYGNTAGTDFLNNLKGLGILQGTEAAGAITNAQNVIKQNTVTPNVGLKNQFSADTGLFGIGTANQWATGIQGVNAIAGLGQLGLGIAQYSQARKVMDFQKKLAEANYEGTRKTVNEQLGNKAYNRAYYAGTSFEDRQKVREEYLSGTHEHAIKKL